MICATQCGGGDGRWQLMHGSTGRRALGCKPGIGGGCGCDYGCYERCGVHSSLQIRRYNILQGYDSIRIEIEFISLTRCIYGHKGNY